MRRLLNITVFSSLLFFQYSRIAKRCRPDVVIVSSPHPFTIYGAHKIAKCCRAKLIAEVRDLWPLSLIELGGLSPRHPLVFSMQRAENTIYRVSDRVLSLLPGAESYMMGHGLGVGKFVYVPNGINLLDWQIDKKQNSLPSFHGGILSQLRHQGSFIVGYVGSHGKVNDLDSLLEAASLVRTKQVSFVFVGDGPEKETLQKKARMLGLTNSTFLPSVARAAIPSLLSSMDALFIGLRRGRLFRFGISPNKLMDYMMAGKPVICAIEAGNDIVAKSNCGISIPAENPTATIEALSMLMSITPAKRRQMGLNGRDYVMAHHNYQVIARRCLENLDD